MKQTNKYIEKWNDKIDELCDKYGWFNNIIIRYYKVLNFIKNIPYKIKNRFITKRWEIKTSLSKWEYHDLDSLMLYAIMRCIEEYVELEGGLDNFDPKTSGEHDIEVKIIYDWWKNYPNREKEIEDLQTVWYNSTTSNSLIKGGKSNSISDTPESRKLFYDLNIKEDLLDIEERDMLIRAISIRSFLWT